MASETRTTEASNTGEAILGAAVELFARRGYHATSMRDLAAAVSIRPSAVYHWYESKESILVKLQEAFIVDLWAVVKAAIESQSAPEARMAAAVREHVAFHGLHSRAAFATDSEIRALSPRNRERIIAQRDAYQDRFISLIRAGVTDGVFEVADVRVASYAVLLQCTGVAMWFDPHGSRSLDEIGEIHVQLVLGSLGANRKTVAAAVEATRPR